MKHFFPKLVFGFAFLWPLLASSAERESYEAVAPADHETLYSVRGGTYFIAATLKQKYEALRAKLEVVKAEMAMNKIASPEALKTLTLLKTELDALQTEVDEKKVLVSPVKVVTETTEYKFPLGTEKLVVITGDALNIEGWEGPGIRCVLEKSVLANDPTDAQAELKEIRVLHTAGVAREIVGRTLAEVEADEREFMASEAGQKISEKHLQGRKELVQQIIENYRRYQQFQGKEIDRLELSGITGQQGNRHIGLKVSSAGGTEEHSGAWKRQAKLTIYLPPCKGVALRGCRVALAVKGIKADSLLVTSNGSHDIDYNGKFSLENVQGNVLVNDVPVDRIGGIQGNLTLQLTREFSNTGTTHEHDSRLAYVADMPVCAIHDVSGDLLASVGRMKLWLAQLKGKVDVVNDFGNTELVLVNPLAKVNHRIVSQSGQIEVKMSKALLAEIKVMASTQYGRLLTNASQQEMTDLSFTGHDLSGKWVTSWRAFYSKLNTPQEEAERESLFGRVETTALALDGKDCPAGLYLISRGGQVEVKVRD